MSLQQYRAKRHFQYTPEPRGGRAPGEGPLRFVIQKHAASHLHFDLRLEAGGTLKSWAVPKGPSLDPAEKRLAMQVEDHPLDYAGFEGIIPAGNYGAGTVMVWDEGTYHLPGIVNREECDRRVRHGLHEGRFHFVLHGKKLRGEWIIVRPGKGKPNEWLFFKKQADSLSFGVQGEEDRSVITNRTMAEVADQARPIKGSRAWEIDLSEAPKGAMPHGVKPMLANQADEPFDDPRWLFEVKWDGYRAISEVRERGVRLYSRNRLSFNAAYAPVVEALEHLGHEAVIDGEVVVVDARGKSQFQLLQQYGKAREGTLVYYVFDLLWLDGHDLRNWPLERRKETLAQLVVELPGVRFSEHVPERGTAFFEAVASQGLEGIMAKEALSRYRVGVRSHSWLKIKTHQTEEAVIGGFTEPRGSRKAFGSLVLGMYDGDDLVYVGHTGTGFDNKTLADMYARLEPLTQKACPFRKRPKTNSPAHWVEPQLVCEVAFSEWTGDGYLRHPVFLRLRDDIAPAQVRLRKGGQAQRNGAEKDRAPTAPPTLQRKGGGDKRARKGSAERGVGTDAGVPRLDGPTHKSPRPAKAETPAAKPQLTNLTKVYWPAEGYTKGDLIDYYREVASVILPYLRDRPESLHRHPGGIRGESFFHKNMRHHPPPPWVKTVNIRESDGKETETLVCQDEPTLLYLANLGCIEINPWHCRIESLEMADYALLDLDPVETSFDRVIEAAQEIHRVLDGAGAESVCKTSGKRGLHVYIPLGGRYTHEEAKQFGELIAHVVHARLPATTSLVRQPSGRRGRVYLDFLQNGRGKTLAAAYCVRPIPGALVSTPLKWSEVRRGLDPTRFTMRTLAKRLDRLGDLWRPVLGRGPDLRECVERLAASLTRNGRA